MSDKIYIILSNNKEQGPFGLEELLTMSLKPHDLIWVEGSTGWRSPSEIEALKPYLNTTENNLKKTDTNSNRIFFSYPKNISAQKIAGPSQAIPLNHPTDPEENEEALTAKSLEMKADKIYQRVLAYNDHKEQHPEIPVSAGAHSLQELREEYTLWHQQQKKKENLNSKKRSWIKLGIGGVVIASLLFIAMRSIGVGEKTAITPQPYITNSISPATGKELNKLPVKEESAKEIITAGPIKKDAALVIPISPHKELSVDEFIDSVRQVMARQR